MFHWICLQTHPVCFQNNICSLAQTPCSGRTQRAARSMGFSVRVLGLHPSPSHSSTAEKSFPRTRPCVILLQEDLKMENTTGTNKKRKNPTKSIELNLKGWGSLDLRAGRSKAVAASHWRKEWLPLNYIIQSCSHCLRRSVLTEYGPRQPDSSLHVSPSHEHA